MRRSLPWWWCENDALSGERKEWAKGQQSEGEFSCRENIFYGWSEREEICDTWQDVDIYLLLSRDARFYENRIKDRWTRCLCCKYGEKFHAWFCIIEIWQQLYAPMNFWLNNMKKLSFKWDYLQNKVAEFFAMQQSLSRESSSRLLQNLITQNLFVVSSRQHTCIGAHGGNEVHVKCKLPSLLETNLRKWQSCWLKERAFHDNWSQGSLFPRHIS